MNEVVNIFEQFFNPLKKGASKILQDEMLAAFEFFNPPEKGASKIKGNAYRS